MRIEQLKSKKNDSTRDPKPLFTHRDHGNSGDITIVQRAQSHRVRGSHKNSNPEESGRPSGRKTR